MNNLLFNLWNKKVDEKMEEMVILERSLVVEMMIASRARLAGNW